jgi:hypothetical protein
MEATPAEIDAYVQRLLEEKADADSVPDSSLGPYVTSVLRSADPTTEGEEDLPEYESLRELIEEHCWIDSSKSETIIKQIAAAVQTKQIPYQSSPGGAPDAGTAVSPLHANNLIPGDLWGDVDPQSQQARTSSNQALVSNNFPSLGAAGHDQMTSPSMPTAASTCSVVDPSYHAEQAFESAVEILLSMNPEVSEESARQALQMGQGDLNLGQFLIGSAMSAKPICRHLLNDGCYLRDCQFSHDIEGHTCAFWLRGRCGKGTTCRFRHGFDEGVLHGVTTPNAEPDSYEAAFPQVGAADPPLSSLPASKVLTSEPVWGRTSSTSFANIASQRRPDSTGAAFPSLSVGKRKPATGVRRVDIPQDLWHAHENRDAALFYIPDPLERYEAVNASVRRKNVVDLHL